MRKIFPLKPVSSSSNCIVPNSTAESVQKDTGQPKQHHNSCNCKDDSVARDIKGRDNLKGLKENSLGARLRRDHLSPVRPPPCGEENFPFARDNRPRITPRHDVAEEIVHKKRSRPSSSSSSSIFSTSSTQRSLNYFIDAGKPSTVSGDILTPGFQPAPVAVISNSEIEDRWKKHANKMTKIQWTKRSVSVPKSRLGETNKVQIPVSAECNSLQTPMVSERLFELSLEKEVEDDKFIFDKPRESTPIPFEKVSTEVVHATRLIKSQSVKLNDSYSSFPNLAEKTSLEEPGSSALSASMKGSVLTTGDSVTDRFSFRCKSARTVAESLFKTLNGNSKSHLTKVDNLDIKKSFDWETNAEDEYRVGVVTEVSLTASDFVDPHSCSTEEESSSLKLFEDSPPRSQGLNSEYHRIINESMCGTLDPIAQIGRTRKPLASLRQKQENRDRLNMWLEGYVKVIDTDEELERKVRVAEEQAQLLLEEMDFRKPYGGPNPKGASKKKDINLELLQQKVKMLYEEKRNLSLEVACEVRSRIAERSAANETLKLIKDEIECRVKMVEKDKNVLQSTLEKELDRRSSEWGNRLEKIKLEEKRLRDRVRDLAEQNVALQRDVSYFNNKGTNLNSQVRESELYMDGFNTRLKDAENEIAQLRQSLTESHKQTKEAEHSLQSIKSCYDAKERENHALQKSIVRLQRLCKDQERTISGLWQGLNDEINDIPQEKNDHATKLQQELMRAAGAEQSVHKDLVNCRNQTDSLRQESTHLVDGLRSRNEGTGFGLIKLDRELWVRLDGLQAQALSILDEYSLLCAKLLQSGKYNMYNSNPLEAHEGEGTKGELGMEQKASAMVEHEMNLKRLKSQADAFKKSVHMVKGVLKEKTLITCNNVLRQDMEKTEAWQSEDWSPEVREHFIVLQDELKAETLISRLLRENLCSREVEMEQLQKEIATLIRSRELAKTEIARLQNLLGSASHKMADLEFQLRGKEERVIGLEADLEQSLKEVAALRENLDNVSKERDMMREESEQLGWEIMRLNTEVEAFKKKVEKLDEDVMIKDGQISILRESLDDFDFLQKP